MGQAGAPDPIGGKWGECAAGGPTRVITQDGTLLLHAGGGDGPSRFSSTAGSGGGGGSGHGEEGGRLGEAGRVMGRAAWCSEFEVVN